MNLGERIYTLRTTKNMSQTDLAEALDVSRQSVSKWENNNAVPDLDKLVKLSQLFGITLDELVTGNAPASSASASTPEVHRTFTRREKIGILFFCAAAFVFLYFCLNHQAPEGLLIMLPIALCGLLCFTKLRHILLWCVWTLCLPLVYTPMRYSFRADIGWALELSLYLPLFLTTVWGLRAEPVIHTKRTALFLVLGYVVCFAFFLGLFLLRHTYYLYTAATHFIEATVFLIFTSVVSVTIRLLKQV